MFSSGTTGLPKCIVQSAGGVLLNQLKEHVLHCSLTPEDNLFYFTTCGWMMWNWLVAGLGAGACITLYDGNPMFPDPNVLVAMGRRSGRHRVWHQREILGRSGANGCRPQHGGGHFQDSFDLVDRFTVDRREL